MTLRPLAPVLLLSLVAGAPLAAQSLQVDGRHLRPATDSFTITIDGQQIGTAVQVTSRTTVNGAPAWLQTYRYRSAGGDVGTDTLVMDGRTLRPIREARTSSLGHFTFAFEEGVLVATRLDAPPDSATRRIPFTGHPHSSAAMDALARALPLADGLAGTLDLIYPPPAQVAQHLTSVQVVGKASIAVPGRGTRKAWVVVFGEPGSATTFWVDQKDRTLLQFDTQEGATTIRFRR